MNSNYAPYLPADDEGSTTIDNYVRMLDKKYSLEPLIHALNASEKSSFAYQQISCTRLTQKINVRILHYLNFEL